MSSIFKCGTIMYNQRPASKALTKHMQQRSTTMYGKLTCAAGAETASTVSEPGRDKARPSRSVLTHPAAASDQPAGTLAGLPSCCVAGSW
jgi:hypothetical protein